MATCLT